MADGRKEPFLEDDDGHLYRAFSGFVRMDVKVEIYGSHISLLCYQCYCLRTILRTIADIS